MTGQTRPHSLPVFSLTVLAAILLTAVSCVSTRDTGQTAQGTAQLEKLWETPKELSSPESVLYDAQRSRIYVSNVAGDPVAKDGNGFISVLSPEGQIVTSSWISGLDAPKGMEILGSMLYVSDIDRLVEIDIDRGEIVRTIPAEGALFLNDVTVDPRGTVYVSDYGEGHSAIYRLEGDLLTAWIQDERLMRPNGLLAESDRLIAGTANGRLLAIDYATAEIRELADLSATIAGIDGIAAVGDGTWFVSDWAGSIIRVDPETLGSGEPEVVSNTSAQEVQAADIGFALDRSLLLVPTFNDNRVMAYRVER